MDVDFNLDKILVNLFRHVEFYAEISRNIRKIPTDDIKTACVSYDKERDELVMRWSPKFFSTLKSEEVMGVVVHEFEHIIKEHLTSRHPGAKFNELWNIATDLAINSLISSMNDQKIRLPECALVPGKRIKDAEKALSDFIEKLQSLQSAEHYFNLLKKQQQLSQGQNSSDDDDDDDYDDKNDSGDNGKNGAGKGNTAPDKNGKGTGKLKRGKSKNGSDSSNEPSENGSDGNSPSNGQQSDKHDPSGKGGSRYKPLDDHSTWQTGDGQKSGAENTLEKEAIQEIIEKAIKAADEREKKQHGNGWGLIPASVRDELHKRVSKTVNWKKVLRQFIGSLSVGNRTSTIKRLNRKQPYIHSGIKRGRTAKLLVAIDQSGSVSDELLALFFAEMHSLTRLITIDYVPFDASCSEKQVTTLRKGSKPVVNRVKRGGTIFDAVVEMFNSPKNRGRWDALLIVTDGGSAKPRDCRKKLAYVMLEGYNTAFETNATKIFIKK